MSPTDRPADAEKAGPPRPGGPPGPGDERLRFALDVAGLGLWDLDLEAHTAFRSLRHDQIFGYEDGLAEWTYETFLDHVVPEDREVVDGAFREAREQGDDWDVECRIRRADGAVRWIWARGRVWGGERGPSRMLGVVADVTETVRAREARDALADQIRADERRVRLVLEQMPVGVSIAEAPSGRLLFHNEEAVRLLRHPLLPSESTEGYAQYGGLRPDGEPYAPADYPMVRALAGETVRSEEMAYRRGDGTLTTLSVSAAPVHNRDASVDVAVVTFEDVSAQKTAAAALRRLSVRLAEAGESERRAVARELHDELGGLLTSLQMSLRMNPARDPEARAEIAESEGLVEAMIDKVRELALDLRPSLLDDLGLGPALDQLTERFATRTRIEVALHCEVEAGDRFEPSVETTAYRVVQEALTNVARHAGVERAQVLCHREPDRLVLHVVDEGAGFDVGEAEAGASTGLASMRERVALVGGALDVASAPGVGTRVTATLPL